MYLQGLEDTGKGEECICRELEDTGKGEDVFAGTRDTGKGEDVFAGTRGYR